MKNITYIFITIYLLFGFLNTASAQIIMESKGQDIKVRGAETIKIFGGFKNTPITGSTQPQLYFEDEGGKFYITDTLCNDTDWPLFFKTSSGEDRSNVIFQSNNTDQLFIMGDSINFYKTGLDMDVSSHNVVLLDDIYLRDTFQIQNGKMNIRDRYITLLPRESDTFSLEEPQPYIIGENWQNYIWDTLGGAIMLDICVPRGEIETSYNFGGIGLELETNDTFDVNADILQLTR